MSDSQYKVKVTLGMANYSYWKEKMLALLVLQDLQDVLDQEEPENPIDSDDDSDREDEEQAKKLKLYRAWVKKSRKVNALIQMNIDEHNTQRIKGIIHGREAWIALKNYHERNTVGNSQRLQERISTLRKRNDVSMELHMDQLFDLVSRYKEAGADYSDSEFVNRILNSIRGTHKHLCDSIGVQSEFKKDPWGLRMWLLDYAGNEEEEKDAVALQVRGEVRQPEVQENWNMMGDSDGDHGPKVQVRSEVHAVEQKVIRQPVNQHANYTCNGCKQRGHIRFNCPINKMSINQLEYMLEMKKKNKAKAASYGQEYTSCVVNSKVLNKNVSWIIDSGATSHMTPQISLFTSIDRSHRSSVIVANGKSLEVKGIGKININLTTNKDTKVLCLENVLYVPGLSSNLFSIREFTSNGKSVGFDSSKVYLITENEKLIIGQMTENHYKLYDSHEAMLVDQLLCKHELHKRFAHRNLQDIKHMISLGLPAKRCECSDICEDCLKGKMSRRPFVKAHEVQEVLDVIVSDVHGPMPIESTGKKRYFITFIDVKSHYCEVQFIRQKSDVPECTIQFIERVKTQLNRKPKVFRSDRGTEYMDQRLQSYLAREGIWYETTVGYCPQQNGVAERKNRTLGEAALTLLSDSNLPKSFWAEAVNHANYCNNRVISRKANVSPLQMFCGDKPDWDKMRKFGSEVYMLIPEQKRNKLEPKSKKMKFVGFDQHAKGYRVTDGHTVVLSREIKFLEDSKGKQKRNQRKLCQKTTEKKVENSAQMNSCDEESFFYPVFEEKAHDADEEQEVLVDAQVEEEVPSDNDSENEDFQSANSEQSEEENHHSEDNNDEEVEVQQIPRRSTRTTAGTLPQRFNDYVMQSHAMFVSNDPSSDREAMKSCEAQHWREAKKEELAAIIRNKTWEVANLPKGRKAIGSKWVFKSKMSANGEKQYKARLVAQGFTQQAGIDYNDVFAPVANSTTLKILLTVAGLKSFHVRHYDVKSAFLNGLLQEEIYMRPPSEVDEKGKVYRLLKSLYGLKQAANVWNQKLHETLIKNGSVQSKDDNCLYSYTSGGVKIYLLIHVDDILAATNSVNELHSFMRRVGKGFEIKDLGEAMNYLGIRLQRNGEGFFEISQSDYIDKVLQVTEMTDAKVSRIPMDTGYHKLNGTPLDTNEGYRKLIGMLLYLSVNSRPDIAAPVAILCQKVSAPTDSDLNEAKRVLRYLKGTKDIKLTLGTSRRSNELWAYTDSDWAEDQIDRKSNSGFVCFLSNSPIMWKSKKQTIVATSSAEAEYIAMSTAAKEIIWIRRLIEGFGLQQNGPTPVHSDSMSAIAMVSNPKSGSKTKHIDTKFHHVKDLVSNKVLKLEYVPTERNVADVLTKPLGKNKLKQFRELLGFTDSSEIEEEC